MRALLAAALVLLAAGEARAQARRDVLIESEPSGADVYLNSKDDGSLCKTPCTIKAPVGEQAVIVELANHVPALESIIVPRRGKAAPLRLRLVRAVGLLIVKGPEGARIRVGDADKGKAPAKLDIDAGPHTVTLTLNGKQVLQELIEIEPDQEVTLRGKDVATGPAPPDETPEIIDDTEPGETGGGGVSQQGPRARPPRGPIVAVAGLIDVGFRRFTYENPMTPILGDEKEGGQVIAGPMIEVWPGTIAGVRALRGFAVIGRFQFPLNKQPVTGEGLSGTTTTFWQSLEISARHRWTFTQGTIDVGAGFVRDQHQFNTENTDDLNRVPDADYRSIRIGVRGSLRLGLVEPYLAAENRIVVSGGKVIEDRFTLDASASGLRGALGATAKLGPIHGRLEGSYTRYSWTFKSNPTDMFQADGASDSIFIVSAGVGYAY
ncbi:MAG TPA: PEGA domain-containing protein [Kofleriaceae bacterium]|nr:PEGA domain-containing protein [Kofleriaceae bacterium]